MMNFSTPGAKTLPEGRQDIFAALLEMISEPIFVIEPQSGCILEANAAAAACFGIPNEELVCRTIESIFPGCEKWLLADAGILRAEACWEGGEGVSIPFNLTGRCVSYSGCPAILLFARESAAREAASEAKLQFQGIEYATIPDPGHGLSSGSVADTPRGAEPEAGSSLKARLAQAERQILLETLSLTNGVKKRAATMLGIDRRNFSYFLHKHGIQ